MSAMPINDALQVAALGALLGATGQMVRVVAGLKKMHDTAAAAAVDSAQMFRWSEVVVSVLIGAAAGVLGAFALPLKVDDVGKDLLTIVAFGYAGADFIEAFMKGRGSSITTAPPVPGAATTAPKGTPEPPAVG
jgi:hypothetical protein